MGWIQRNWLFEPIFKLLNTQKKSRTPEFESQTSCLFYLYNLSVCTRPTLEVTFVCVLIFQYVPLFGGREY